MFNLLDALFAVLDVARAIPSRKPEERMTFKYAFARRRKGRMEGRTGIWGLDDWDDDDDDDSN